MVNASLDMGNLNPKVSKLNNKLVTKEKEKATLQEELDISDIINYTKNIYFNKK